MKPILILGKESPMHAPQQRKATDIHPKVVAGTAIASVITAVIAIFGLDVSPGVAAGIATAANFVMGYLKSA